MSNDLNRKYLDPNWKKFFTEKEMLDATLTEKEKYLLDFFNDNKHKMRLEVIEHE